VTVHDPLPGGVSFVSAVATQGTCSGASTVECTLGTLAPNASATVTIVVTAGGLGPLVNRATVSSEGSDPNGSNDSSTAVTAVAGSTIPALSLWGRLVFVLALIGAAFAVLQRAAR
jgi:hypothetical protein